MPATKIATCCYCGSRTTLELRGKKRHELACTNCGAPLHYMKGLPVEITPARMPHPKPKKRGGDRHDPPRRPAKRRKRGRTMARIFDKIWDELEDIFD